MCIRDRYVTDGYRDTVEDGIAIVKEYIEGLAKDEKTKALVSMVLRLLARDAKGTLDVYKRQQYPVAKCLLCSSGVVFLYPLQALGRQTIEGCLLYTSRCV